MLNIWMSLNENAENKLFTMKYTSSRKVDNKYSK